MSMRSWKDALRKQLIEKYGEQHGKLLDQKYHDAFPLIYTAEYSPATAVHDISFIEEISSSEPFQITFYYVPEKKDKPLHLRLFQWDKPIPLSDILPMLENLDLRIESEQPHEITLDEKHSIWISDFVVTFAKPLVEIEQMTDLFEDAFSNIYLKKAENDGFNKLLLNASLSWREIAILRTYAKYLHQLGFHFSQNYIETALLHNANIAKDLVSMFKALHDPKVVKHKEHYDAIKRKILKALENVPSLDEDRIIHRLLDLIAATLRTNYFQVDENGDPKEYISIKINSRAIPEMPLPVPLFEIYVYSPNFEGIHLRNTKVARGGIRYSDRPEDFRTEILGLMKAQTVKNSIIVPSGAKGGFVIKSKNTVGKEEVIACYSLFISGLLDLTDNIINDETVPPINVVCYDEPDTYLVVAADKGTASFSDIANALAAKYKFWLGDAFASGGSTGYDHKKMGITARGAWESIKRHFRELDINIENTDITLVGIGDLSGDVFGNGMLYTEHIKLMGAFNHRDIFLDPNPDPVTSFQERLRLFSLPASSWSDYSPSLISKGGGVFSRSLKSIPISREMQEVLDITDEQLTPNDLIKAILKAPVDLLFNGGIGTFVKASMESDSEVGDRTNDYCRVNANELRCKVVGEGGNLGFTQLARVEYAAKGGLINTDFIDNSAGVDCSDHEVNLKILLDAEVHKGKLTHTERNEILASLTQEVAALVLRDNYHQALVLSVAALYAKKNLSLQITFIKELEAIGILKRTVEFLPTDKELAERKAVSESLTRPELAVLLAYTKIATKQEILKSSLPEDPFAKEIIVTAFPRSIREKYHNSMDEHRLKREIIATQISNKMIDTMGITFIHRMSMETGATMEEIVRAYLVASNIFQTRQTQKYILSLDFKVPLAEQYSMLHHVRNLISLSTRWFLHTNLLKSDLGTLIHFFGDRVKILEDYFPNLMSGNSQEAFVSLSNHLQQTGIPFDIAQRIAVYRSLYTVLNAVYITIRFKFDLMKTAKVFFAAAERLNLGWFREQVANDTREGHWNILARLNLLDELDVLQRGLTVAVLNTDPQEENISILVDKWVNENRNTLRRWDRLLTLVHESGVMDYTIFFIALHELMNLVLLSLRGKMYEKIVVEGF